MKLCGQTDYGLMELLLGIGFVFLVDFVDFSVQLGRRIHDNACAWARGWCFQGLGHAPHCGARARPASPVQESSPLKEHRILPHGRRLLFVTDYLKSAK